LLKFERIEPLGEVVAVRLAKIVTQNADALGADVVVPVPLHCDREKERGYKRQNCYPKRWRTAETAAPRRFACQKTSPPRKLV